MNCITYIKKNLFSLLIPCAFLSCKKFVDIQPNDRLLTSDIFADSATAGSAMTGIYTGSFTIRDLLNGGATIYPALSSDELKPVSSNKENLQYYTNAVDPNTNGSIYTNLWRSGYRILYSVNACIEGLEQSNGIGTTIKNNFIGEAKLVRAFIYFNLVNLFGDVPMTLSTDYAVNAKMPRTAKDTILRQIVADLTEAKDKLSGDLTSQGRFRPNRYAALALLSRVYLYQKKWDEAEAISTELLNNSAAYDLVSELNDVFKPGSKEVIWQLPPILPGIETIEGYSFIPSSSTIIPAYSISDRLLNSFEAGDQRKVKWLSKNTVTISGVPTDFYYPYKYKLGRDGWSGSPSEAYCVFRVSEQYLIRAEARAEQNNISGAAEDIDRIRIRAGLPTTAANDKDQMLTAILTERRTELFCEWGHRWFDLKRLGQVNDVMAVETVKKGGTWRSDWQLYPLPFTELTANPFLIQNPGYY